jgi:hypothetical protein
MCETSFVRAPADEGKAVGATGAVIREACHPLALESQLIAA